MFSKQVLAEMQLYVNYINRFKKDIEEMLTRRLPAEKETAVLELDKKALLQRVKYVWAGLTPCEGLLLKDIDFLNFSLGLGLYKNI